jgi:signal transduction histidine kinase
MTRLRAFFDSTCTGRPRFTRAFWEGQFLALTAAGLAVAAQVLVSPLLDHSTYFLGALALLGCAVLRGGAAALTTTVLLAVGGYFMDDRAQLPEPERIVRALAFLSGGIVGAFAVERISAARPPRLTAPPEPPAHVPRGQGESGWSANATTETAARLAHELNQSLTAVTSYLRASRTLIARLELKDDALIDAVSRAGDQALRAGRMVRGLRDLATCDGPPLQPVSLSAAIREVEIVLRLSAHDAGVQMHYDLCDHDLVLADRTQIQQLLVNLIRHSIEAVSKYPKKQISISTRPASGGYLLTRVEDSGPRPDPGNHDCLIKSLPGETPDGTGIGLSISSAIVYNHRGRIWVEPSRLGGAAVCFVLAQAGKDGEDAGVRSHGLRRR